MSGGFLSEVQGPDGATYSMTYENGLLKTFTDPNDTTSTLTFDSSEGRLQEDRYTAPDPDEVTTLDRSDTTDGYKVTVTNPAGRVATHEVDNSADGIEFIDNEGAGDLTEEDVNGNSVTTTLPDGTQITKTLAPDPRFGMDAAYTASQTITTPGGRGTSQTRSITATLADSSDPTVLSSWQQVLTLPGNHSYTTTYDPTYNTLTTTSPGNRTRVTTLDSNGRVIKTQIANLDPITTTYDAEGRIYQVIQEADPTPTEVRTTTYGYLDESGNDDGYLKTLTTSGGLVFQFSNDAYGRITSTTRASDGSMIATAFDAAGNLTSVTPPDRPAHTFTPTIHYQTASYQPPPANPGDTSTPIVYDYTPDRLLKKVTFPGGRTIDFHHDDPAGRISTIVTPDGTTTFAYDATTHHLASITPPAGDAALSLNYDGFLPLGVTWSGPIAGSVGFDYDDSLRLNQVSVDGSVAYTLGHDDPDGLLTAAGAMTITRKPDTGFVDTTSVGAATTVTTSRSYSEFGEIVGESADYQDGTTTTPLWSYQIVPGDGVPARDKDGRVLRKEEVRGGVTTVYRYGYDTVTGRLTDVWVNQMLAEHYTYDSNGNRLTTDRDGMPTITATYDDQDRLVTFGDNTYTYDDIGQLATKTNTVTQETTEYTYDVRGALRHVGLPDGTNIDYVLDALGRRVGRKVDGTLTGAWLYLDSLNPVAELNPDGTVKSIFVYGTRPNVPDLMIQGATTYRFITDHLGTVRMVISTTDGSVAQELTYDAFGRVLSDTNPGFQPFGFAGGLYDPATGLVRFGVRDYDVETGRWTGKDALLFQGKQVNLYVYVGDDPINSTDPYGLWRLPDYISANVNVAIPNPFTGTLIGWSGTASVDRYGDVFWSPAGVGFGKSASTVSESVTANWLDCSGKPSRDQLSNFLSKSGSNGAVGYWGGVTQSYTPGAGWATGVGFVSPQAGVSYNYSFSAGNIGVEW